MWKHIPILLTALSPVAIANPGPPLDDQCVAQWKSYGSDWSEVPQTLVETARRIDKEQGGNPDIMLIRYHSDNSPNDLVPEWWYAVGAACMVIKNPALEVK